MSKSRNIKRNELIFMDRFDNAARVLKLKYRCCIQHRNHIHIYGGINPYWWNHHSMHVVILDNSVYIHSTKKQWTKLIPILEKLKKYNFVRS